MPAMAEIVRGKQSKPFAAVLYGVEGVGKTSMAAEAPNSIVLDFEGGSDQLETARVYVSGLEEFHRLLSDPDVLAFSTIVIDTADWLERLVSDVVCRRHRKSTLAEFGFGKDQGFMENEFATILEMLKPVKLKHNIIFTAHAQVSPYRNPMGEDYDQYSLKLTKKPAALLKEWCDTILFLNYKDFAKKSETGKVKAMGDGMRTLYTEHRPAFAAKNRYGLPVEIDVDEMDKGAIWRMMVPQVNFEALRVELYELRDQLEDEDLKKKGTDGIHRAGDSTRQLSAIKKWLLGKVNAQKEKTNQ